MYPKMISFKDIKVNKNNITLYGPVNFPEDSGVACRNYKASYYENILYIKVKGVLAGVPLAPNCPFDITIPNKYGKIDKIYLQGDKPSENVLIWPVNSTIRKSRPYKVVCPKKADEPCAIIYLDGKP